MKTVLTLYSVLSLSYYKYLKMVSWAVGNCLVHNSFFNVLTTYTSYIQHIDYVIFLQLA